MKKILLGLLAPLLVIIIIASAFSFFALYLPYKSINAKGQLVVASAKQMKVDFKSNNIDVIKNRMNDIDAKYQDFQNESKKIYWLTFIPQLKDYKNGVEAGDYMIRAAQESVKAIEPYADLIGFKKGATSFSNQPPEDRLATAVTTLDKVIGKIDPISEDINQADIRLNTIDPNRYPEKVGNKVVRANIVLIKENFEGLKSLFVDAKPLLKQIPDLLGAKTEKVYLVLYQNENEQRATGGFLTYYAIFKIKNGRMHVESSKDMYSLDSSIAVHPVAPRIISTYHIDVPKLNIRDSNFSPDFVESMKIFNSLYDKSGDKVKYDGVITVNSKILTDLLTIYGDTTVDGINFSAKIDPACDCPDVIYKLSNLVDKPTPYLRENRKAILGDLMQETIRKALGISRFFGQFVQTMFTNMDEKNILLYFPDAQLQKTVESLNYAGRIRAYDGDYLNVNNSNFAGAKSNLFVKKTLTSDTKFNNGSVERTVTMTFKNPHPGSDCNLEHGNLCLNAKLRDLIRVYVPQGSQLISMKGGIIKDAKYKQYDELGKTVFEAYIEVLPLGKAEATFTYKLPSSITQDNYKLLIQKQAGEKMELLNVNVNGVAKKVNVPMNTDFEIK